MCFFLEVPRIEELQDPSNSPRRGEVGRRTNPEVRGGGIGAPYEPPRDRIRPCLGGHGAWAGHEAMGH